VAVTPCYRQGGPDVGPGALILTESNVSPVFFDENQTQVDLDAPSTPQISGPIQSTDHRK
jgi:hypothetical protein